MGKLYIIGNGFDLHFGLHTSTSDYQQFLMTKHIYGQVDNALDYFSIYGVDWSDFELSLSDFDFESIEEENEQYPDYLSDHESDRDNVVWNMEMLFESLNNAIDEALQDMVEAANEQIDEELVNKEFSQPIQLFDNGDAVLSFNYTSTVERLFYRPNGVPIFHIHGFYENNEPLILGYKLDDRVKFPIRWKMNEENGDYYVEQQYEIAYDFYQQMGKTLQINKLSDFLNKLSINEVIVLGHAMGEVDFEYMEIIDKMLNPARWLVSWYDVNDKKDILNRGYSFVNKIQFCKIEDIL